jgi:DNA replication initiation complex subunit (GINS family)
MITYNDIYEASRKERYSDRLCPLPKKFVSEVAIYLKEKKEAAAREGDAFSEVVIKTKKQLENAITLFRELMLRRRKKILSLVLIAAETGISKQDFDNMLSFEKDLFEEIMKCVEKSDKEMNSLLNGATEKEEKKNELVIFLESVPEFVGLDGNPIGPFEMGQIANLPNDVVSILTADKKCEKVSE